jgi:hypothetical protein
VSEPRARLHHRRSGSLALVGSTPVSMLLSLPVASLSVPLPSGAVVVSAAEHGPPSAGEEPRLQ